MEVDRSFRGTYCLHHHGVTRRRENLNFHVRPQLLCDFHDGTFIPASVLPPIATTGETGDESLVMKVPAIVGHKDRDVSYRATAVNDRM
jgi:hypothetical protein